jgi:hypothetical protein
MSKLLQLFENFEGVITTLEENFELNIREILEVHESRWQIKWQPGTSDTSSQKVCGQLKARPKPLCHQRPCIF